VLDKTSMLASRSIVRSGMRRERLIEPRTHDPAVVQETLANSFHPDERSTPLGEPGDPEGGCTRCFGAECALPFGLGGTPDS
jgi:hypothetical protein